MIPVSRFSPRWHWGRLNSRGEPEEVGRRALVVFVPGIFATLPQPWQYDDLLRQLDAFLARRFPQRDWLPFHYRATFWSTQHPDAIAAELSRQIELAASSHAYDSVLLIAHSFGGLILRRAVLMSPNSAWLTKAERIVLLASTSRGLLPATWLQRVATRLGKWLRSDRWGLGRLALSGLKPSPWLDELAADWRGWLLARKNHTPRVIQIQGERDRVVELADDADLNAMPGVQEEILPAVGHRYFMLQARWFKLAPPSSAEALLAVQRSLERALTDDNFIYNS